MPDIQQILEHTSRTFALAIPLLPEPTQTDVTVAYLVFRIADTLEDATSLPLLEREKALQEFAQLLDTLSGSTEFADKWAPQIQRGHPLYYQLVKETPQVLDALAKHRFPGDLPLIQHALQRAWERAHPDE